MRPVLRAVLETLGVTEDRDTSALRLAGALKRIRPELDVYLLSDRRRRGARRRSRGRLRAPRLLRRRGAARAAPRHPRRRAGDRYETPFFDNLKKYARRPIGTFHALPIARGKSVFKSDWIRDMGEFYGINLFLAESSATTGGLDSLLEPTGNIKKAQEMAARAFGADHVFFVTNGTSTSNKMVVQALLAPGDIAHRRPQLPQVAPLRHGAVRRAAALRRGIPDDGILDVRRRAARDDQAGAARPAAPRAASTASSCSTSPTAPSTGTCTTCAG